MFHARHALAFIAVVTLPGCHLLAVGALGMPGWSCLRAKEPIALFHELDLAVEEHHLRDLAGTLDAGEGARIVDRHKDPSGRTTHFRVRSHVGVSGWFAWRGNDFTGFTSNSCW
jgi:hypothetical protein